GGVIVKAHGDACRVRRKAREKRLLPSWCTLLRQQLQFGCGAVQAQFAVPGCGQQASLPVELHAVAIIFVIAVTPHPPAVADPEDTDAFFPSECSAQEPPVKRGGKLM